MKPSQSYDVFVCYQPESEGELARRLHDALHNACTQYSLDIFIDQYDLTLGVTSAFPSTSPFNHAHVLVYVFVCLYLCMLVCSSERVVRRGYQ